MATPLEAAEQAVTEARQSMAFRLPTGQGLVSRHAMAAAIDEVERAVEARYEARLREAANFPHVDDRARLVGHFLADVVAGWPNGSRVRFGPGEGLDAPADACPVHDPTGSPCACRHDAAADCHPGARRTT